jgi:hypothetical protein
MAYVTFFLGASFLTDFSPINYTHSSLPPFVLHAPPSHHPRLDNSNYFWRRVEITQLLFTQFSPSCRHFVVLSNLFSNTLSLQSSLNVRDQISLPYGTTIHFVFQFLRFWTPEKKGQGSAPIDSVMRIQSPITFFLNHILIPYCVPKYLKLPTFWTICLLCRPL